MHKAECSNITGSMTSSQAARTHRVPTSWLDSQLCNSNSNTLCLEKETKMFSVISPIKLKQFWWNLAHCFLNKFAATWCKRFPPHPNNVSTLPCETWNPHHTGATTALSDKETPDFIPYQLWPPNSPDLNPVDCRVWEYCKRRCTKHASLIWMNWNSGWEWSGPSWITSSLWQPFISGVVDSCRSVMHVL